MPKSPVDQHLKTALVKSYAARASLFHRGVQDAKMRELFSQIDEIKPKKLMWEGKSLGISEGALKILNRNKIELHRVLVHPSVLQSKPTLVKYYRNLVAISQKGMSQLGFPTGRFEREPPAPMDETLAYSIAQTLNSIVAKVIETAGTFDLGTSRDVAFAEIGTELQGTWANKVGSGATQAVEEMIQAYIEENGLGEKESKGKFVLSNGWKIRFASEPDVTFLDSNEFVRIVVEIKGSLDKAGAQTRYGEAKFDFRTF